jgi:hypothetical protein
MLVNTSTLISARIMTCIGEYGYIIAFSWRLFGESFQIK